MGDSKNSKHNVSATDRQDASCNATPSKGVATLTHGGLSQKTSKSKDGKECSDISKKKRKVRPTKGKESNAEITSVKKKTNNKREVGKKIKENQVKTKKSARRHVKEGKEKLKEARSELN